MEAIYTCPLCSDILAVYERKGLQEQLKEELQHYGALNEITGILLKFLFTPNYDPQDCSDDARKGIELLKRLLKGQVPSDRSNKRVITPVEVLFLVVIHVLLKLHIAEGAEPCHKIQFRTQTALFVLDSVSNREIKGELQDYFFSFLSPATFVYYQQQLPVPREKLEKAQKMIYAKLISMLKKRKIDATIETRIKSVYSTFRKVQRKNISPDLVDDLLGFRIITHSMEECYDALETIQKRWKGRNLHIQDYIKDPKESGYQSLHLHVPIKNIPVEFQIRDKAMHNIAERGHASHGEYKLASHLDS